MMMDTYAYYWNKIVEAEVSTIGAIDPLSRANGIRGQTYIITSKIMLTKIL